MKFNGRNLALIRRALIGAMAECQTQIGLCPDTTLYRIDLEIFKAEKAEYQAVLDRIHERHPELNTG